MMGSRVRVTQAAPPFEGAFARRSAGARAKARKRVGLAWVSIVCIEHELRNGKLSDACEHVGCQFECINGEVECWIPDARLNAVIDRMKNRIPASSPHERARGAEYFARVAGAPYRWAASWQHEYILEEAQRALRAPTTGSG
jgi:hypothetical protein